MKEEYKKWDKLDNTALLFPVIASESMTSVYRISVTLKEKIDPVALQKAQDELLPVFDIFRVRLKRGLFWYYFETNNRSFPHVREENNYPCTYISPLQNNGYLFRITYYECRINLEVFHVVTDGMGAVNFLRELVYKYLRLTHNELMEKMGDDLVSETSLNKEDSYVKNYNGKKYKKKYKTQRAVELTGDFIQPRALSVMHGYMNIDQLKKKAKEHGVSMNTYLTGVFTYAIYKEYLHSQPCQRPISICVPVNLRPFYDSNTTKNFFAMTEAVYHPDKEDAELDEIIKKVDESLKKQFTKENMDSLITYNVSNQKNLMLRVVPLFIKKMAIKWVYRATALSNTSTVTNVGNFTVRKEYEPYIEKVHVVLSMTKGQNMKCSIFSFKDELVFTISTKLSDHTIQKRFFRTLAAEGIDVTLETNGE